MEIVTFGSDGKNQEKNLESQAAAATEAESTSNSFTDSAAKSTSAEKEESKEVSCENKPTSTKKKYYKKKFHRKNKAKTSASKTPADDSQDENAPLQENKKASPTVRNETSKVQYQTNKKKGFNNNNVNNKMYYQDRRMIGSYLYGPEGIPIVIQRNFSGPQVHRYNQIAKPYGNKHFVAFSPKFLPVPYEIPLSTRSNYSFKNNGNRKNYINHDLNNGLSDNANPYKQKVKNQKPWKYLTPVDVNEVYYGHNPFPKHYNNKKAKDSKKPVAEQPKIEDSEENAERDSIQVSESLAHTSEPTTLAETSC